MNDRETTRAMVAAVDGPKRTTTTKSTHTPGPWRMVGPSDDMVIRGPKSGDSSILIAVMGEHDEKFEDAQLIAAAPELLEALRDLMKSCASWAPTIDRSRARAAIAKAGGRP